MEGDLGCEPAGWPKLPAPLDSSGFSIGGVSVRIEGRQEDNFSFGATLRPFSVDTSAYDIDLRFEWVAELHPMPGRRLFDAGSTWRLYEGESGLRFDFENPPDEKQPYKRLLVDNHFRRGTLQLRRQFFSDFPRANPLGYPLDELLIMHRLTREHAIELHSVGIVGPNGATNLFVGHSGAGKSTTARLWTSLHDVRILSDDRIIVRESPARELQPGDDPRQIFMYGTPWHGEGCFALPERAPLGRIFVLEHGHGNVVTRLSKSQAVAELFARSFVPFHRHEYVESALSFLEYLVESVPVYHYSFEPDERAVEKVLHFQD
jgi:hypothetical protein